MISLKHFTYIVLVAVFLLVMSRTVFPIKPARLPNKYGLCDIGSINSWRDVQVKPSAVRLNNKEKNYIEFVYNQLSQRVMLVCKTAIPTDVLYRANEIGAMVETSQSVSLTLALYRNGAGPTFGPIDLIPKENIQAFEVTKLLNTPQTLKLNWLTGEYDSVAFYVENHIQSKDVTFRIYEVYLR